MSAATNLMPNKAPSVEKVNIRRLWPRTLVWTRRQEGWPSRSEALGPASNDARRFLDPAINIHAVVLRRMLRGSAQAWSRLPWPQHTLIPTNRSIGRSRRTRRCRWSAATVTLAAAARTGKRGPEDGQPKTPNRTRHRRPPAEASTR